MKIFAAILTLLPIIFCIKGNAQTGEFKLQNYHPASPAAFEFLKYTDMPVSEYTGIPNISIPLYSVQEDDVSVPISLSYHAAGIRVNQEASWVGLGWDLNFGSIVQEINDQDDYGSGIIRVKPDWMMSPAPSLYPNKYEDQFSGTPSTVGCTQPVAPEAAYSYKIFSSYLTSLFGTGPNYSDGFVGPHKYYLPINGDCESGTTQTDLVDYPDYDSETDIFSANFLGHSIKFVREYNSNNIIVLDKKGYKITRTGNAYKIVVPEGDEFHFDIVSTTQSSSSSAGGIGPASSSAFMPSSKIWMLTKIITRNKKEIVFSYENEGVHENMVNYSDQWDYVLSSVVNSIYSGWPEGYVQFPVSGVRTTYSSSNEERIILSSITFPKGSISFTTSAREDLIGGKKLDNIEIKSLAGDVVQSFDLHYSYFNASAVGGNTYPLGINAGNARNLRLKLLSLEDRSGRKHVFTYDGNPLPAKNSFAQDFWGFYNGDLSNTSLVPNPARLNSSQTGSYSALPSNGNNNSAQLSYAKSCILTEIKYPTGGRVKFDYELNTFDNYWVPNHDVTSNLTSEGNGLRISSIVFEADNNVLAKKTVYSYSGGKALSVLHFGRSYGLNSLNLYSPPTGAMTSYQLLELNGRGFYSTNSLGSGNSVGYDKVVKQEVDNLGASIGRTETYFNNIEDVISLSANSAFSSMNVALPTTKREGYPDNGTVDHVMQYEEPNRLRKRVDYTYYTLYSDIDYNARIFGYPSVFFVAGSNAATQQWVSYPRALVGYYPLFGKESLLWTQVTTEYDDNGNSLQRNTHYSYDMFDQLASKTERSSTDEYITEGYEHAYDYSNRTSNNLLLSAHRLTDVTRFLVEKRKADNNYFQKIQVYEWDKDYISLGGKVLESKVTINKHPSTPSSATTVVYDVYDPGTGNLLEYTDNEVHKSILWGYNKQYVIAEVNNAKSSDVAYTSFEYKDEDDTHPGMDLGRWNAPKNLIEASSSITGKKSYDLAKGNLSTTVSDQSTRYLLSYWSRNGQHSVTGSTSAKQGVTLNGWTYYEHILTGISTVSLSGSGLIDEVRLYPLSAQMTTYTYEPLVGQTSQTDVAGRISYFEYDELARLRIVRDQNKKIIKTYCYNYAGQSEIVTLFTTSNKAVCLLRPAPRATIVLRYHIQFLRGYMLQVHWPLPITWPLTI